jgi:hypothetical protein
VSAAAGWFDAQIYEGVVESKNGYIVTRGGIVIPRSRNGYGRQR